MKATSESIEEKLGSIYELSKRQLERYHNVRVQAGIVIVSGFIIAASPSVLRLFPDLQYPNYVPMIPGFVAMILVMVGFYIVARSNRHMLSIERRLFLLSFDALLEIRNYLSSKNESYLEEAIRKLFTLHGKIPTFAQSSTSKFEFLQQMIQSFEELKKVVENRILYCLQKRKSIVDVESATLELSNLLSTPSLNDLNSFTSKWASLPEGEFKPEPTKFQSLSSTVKSDPTLSKILRHVGTLAMSTVVVMSFAYALTQLVEVTWRELAPSVLLATFALYVAILWKR